MRITSIDIIFLLALIFIGSLPLCASQKDDVGGYDGVVLVRTVEFSTQNKRLNVGLELDVKGKAVMDYGSILLTPKIVNGGDYLLFPNILIQGIGKNKTHLRWEHTMTAKEAKEYVAPDNLIVIGPECDTLFRYRISMPYEDWMEDAELALNYETTTYRDESILAVFSLGRVVDLKNGKQSTSIPATRVEPELELEQMAKTLETELFFRQGRSTIEPSFSENSKALEGIEREIKWIIDTENAEIHSIEIVGYTSPEGAYSLNAELAKKRALAVAKYLSPLLSRYLGKDKIDFSYYPAEWADVKRYLKQSNIYGGEIVMDLIDAPINDSQREARIRLLDDGRVYRALLSDIYPELRRVDCRINYKLVMPSTKIEQCKE